MMTYRFGELHTYVLWFSIISYWPSLFEPSFFHYLLKTFIFSISSNEEWCYEINVVAVINFEQVQPFILKNWEHQQENFKKITLVGALNSLQHPFLFNVQIIKCNNLDLVICTGDGLCDSGCSWCRCAVLGVWQAGAARTSMDEGMQHVWKILQPSWRRYRQRSFGQP